MKYSNPAASEARAVMILGLAAIALHGYGLQLDFCSDDHNDLELCRRYGYQGLTLGNAFDFHDGGIAHIWWATREGGWAFFRPLAVALRTLQLDLFGCSPLPFHLVCLALYISAMGLFYAVCRRWGAGRDTAFVAALLFMIHPSHTQVADWPACQATVLVTIWMLLAMWLLRSSIDADHGRVGPLLGLFICYALAMLSRETGVILGPILFVWEWLAAKRRRNTNRFLLYTVLAAEAIAFLVIRQRCMQGLPSPQRPYFTSPSEPGFLSWIFHKMLIDFVTVTLGQLYFPVVNVGWLQARPLTTLLLTILALAMAALILHPLRRLPVTWAVVAVTALAAAPALPTFSASYQYYPASAGWATLLALWGKRQPHRLLVAGTFALILPLCLFGSWCEAIWTRNCAATERLMRDAVQACRPAQFPYATQLFFINLPLHSIEVGPAVRLDAARPDLEFYPMSLAPDLFLPPASVTVRQENARTLTIGMDGPGWFCGHFGEEVQLGWFGASRHDFKTGPVHLAAAVGPLPFGVEVVAANHEGITGLRYVFDKPLSDARYKFFLVSSDGVAPLQFSSDGQVVAVKLNLPQWERRMQRLRKIQNAFDWVVNQLARLP